MLLTLIRGINMGLAFALELGVLVALCFYGFAAGRNWFAKIGLGMGLPALAMVIWGEFGSPQANLRLNGIWFLLLQIVFFGSAAVALYAARRRNLGMVFALVFVLNTVLAYVLGQP